MINQKELIEAIMDIRQESIDWLQYNYEQRQSCNSFRAGIEEGQIDTCNRILKIIEFGVEE